MYKIWPAIQCYPWDIRPCLHPEDMSGTCLGQFQLSSIFCSFCKTKNIHTLQNLFQHKKPSTMSDPTQPLLPLPPPQPTNHHHHHHQWCLHNSPTSDSRNTQCHGTATDQVITTNPTGSCHINASTCWFNHIYDINSYTISESLQT